MIPVTLRSSSTRWASAVLLRGSVSVTFALSLPDTACSTRNSSPLRIKSGFWQHRHLDVVDQFRRGTAILELPCHPL